MRTDNSWFQHRLGTTWRAQPGRSCLLIVPPGCDSLQVKREVVSWLSGEHANASPNGNRRVSIAGITADAVSSSFQFVRRLAREFSRSVGSVTQVPEDAYASDWIENIVNAAQADGAHPILVIDRFHAFASIADDHLLSVLSTMRQLEHDGQLTTIAISAMNYTTLRARLSEQGKSPFVNSAYGDNHDRVVMPPLTRTEFVAAAMAAGLNEARAQAVYRLVGGPDSVHVAVINVALESASDIVDRAARSLGDSLEGFFDVAIGPIAADRDDLRLRTAIGQLLPAQSAYLRSLDLCRFLLKEDVSGRSIVASPVIGRLLLSGRDGPWIAYAKVLDAIDDQRFADAARQVTLLDCDSPHLKAFADLVTMLAAVHGSDKGGLLEIDWKTAQRVGRRLLAGNLPIDCHRAWIEQLVRWSERVRDAVDSGQGRGARLDILARQATDPDVRMLLEYALRVFLGRARRAGSPGEQVRAAASIPESILQSLSAYLDLDPLNVPSELPELDYQRFFGLPKHYERPKPGTRLELTDLLVIVPALLEKRYTMFHDKLRLCDPSFVKPLHSRLVLQVRNALAHTYAEMDEKAAAFFFETCDTLLEDATIVWGRGATDAPREDPNREELADLLSGRVMAV